MWAYYRAACKIYFNIFYNDNEFSQTLSEKFLFFSFESYFMLRILDLQGYFVLAF